MLVRSGAGNENFGVALIDKLVKKFIYHVKAIFQDAFENDKTDNEELLNALEQSDREELQELQNQFQAKEAELGLK
ncbi:hypothetical protein Y032_0004g1885 [Ancylostoma ceylanicum]|uniref:Uncharacterized protein n=1 Tax=Ancylostoma ceylanicum TaxID=53326 RepID=A0A016VW54_9BILA|nr:hypothetical protein Y032_0004g1885 [Ancylostoma ceylanicum]